MADKAKPGLTLISPTSTLHELAAYFKQITGREPSREELEAAAGQLDGDTKMPEAHFGKVLEEGQSHPQMDDVDPDDEELEQSPPEVTAALGFDPKDIDNEDDA